MVSSAVELRLRLSVVKREERRVDLPRPVSAAAYIRIFQLPEPEVDSKVRNSSFM